MTILRLMKLILKVLIVLQITGYLWLASFIYFVYGNTEVTVTIVAWHWFFAIGFFGFQIVVFSAIAFGCNHKIKKSA